jgi:hypothetical protein
MADGDAVLLLAPNPSSLHSYQISSHTLQTRGCRTHYLYEPMQARTLTQKGQIYEYLNWEKREIPPAMTTVQ